MKKRLSFLLLALQACISPYEPTLPDLPPKLVVDGLLTDLPGPHKLRLSYSAPFTNSDAIFDRSPDQATIWVSDDKGGRMEYIYLNTARGLYQTRDEVRGVAGRSYTLHIKLADGRQYESKPELLRASPPIDTVVQEYSRRAGTRLKGTFAVSVRTKDPATTGDFYKWKWTHYDPLEICLYYTNKFETPPYRKFPCCVPCWEISYSVGSGLITSDELVNGRAISQPIATVPYDSISPYYLLIEQQSLSKAAYQFWKRANEQTSITGGLFDLPPATVTGNLFNTANANEQVLGFFGVSGVSRKAYFVKRTGVGESPAAPSPQVAYVLQNECYTCREGVFRTAIAPPEWVR